MLHISASALYIIIMLFWLFCFWMDTKERGLNSRFMHLWNRLNWPRMLMIRWPMVILTTYAVFANIWLKHDISILLMTGLFAADLLVFYRCKENHYPQKSH